jgi:hypothetical protein
MRLASPNRARSLLCRGTEDDRVGNPPKSQPTSSQGATSRIKVLGDPIPHQDMALIKTSSSKRYKNEWTRLVRGYRPSSLQLVKGVDRVSGLSGQRAETPPYEQQHFAD